MSQKLASNINKFIAFNALSSFVLYYAIDKLFMSLRGLSVTEIVMVEIVCSVLVLLLEVPSGAISDRWSRKYVLALNVAFFMLNTFCWVIAHDVVLFLVGTTAAAIHMALRSGTDTSFLYDTLTQLGREDEYEEIYGRSLFWENIIAIPAGIVGPVIADHYGLALPFWLTLPFSCAALLVALSFTEPTIHRSTGEVSYWRHIVGTGRLLVRRRVLVHVIGLSIALGATLVLLDEFSQLYFVRVGLPIFAIGFLVAFGHAIEAIAGRYARLLTRFPRMYVYNGSLVLSIIGLGGVWMLAGSYIGLAFVFLPWVGFYAVNPLLVADLHRELPAAQRATAESFVSLAKRVVLIPMALMFAVIADKSSIEVAYGVLALTLISYLVLQNIGAQSKLSLKKTAS